MKTQQRHQSTQADRCRMLGHIHVLAGAALGALTLS